MHLRPWIFGALAVSTLGCNCERTLLDLDTEDTTSTSGASGALTGSSSDASEDSTGGLFDASRWLGRYHYEMPFLPFGERGDPMGPYMLANFEIFEDSTAIMLFDQCSYQPEVIAYEWTPDEPGWLVLHPGAGESSLRYVALENIETLRIHLVEPCRKLEFEINGTIDNTMPFHPGESCWVDRCETGDGTELQVDYCEGEEPPPCP
jgi:hypothetical protein